MGVLHDANRAEEGDGCETRSAIKRLEVSGLHVPEFQAMVLGALKNLKSFHSNKGEEK
jgi:hypothetical protein